MMNRIKATALLGFTFLLGVSSFGQGWNITTDNAYFDELRVINTAVPFLTISPDARAGGMGDAGVAASPDGNAIYWNAAKLAFLEDGTLGGSISYTPWLSRLVPDIDLAFLSGYGKIGKNQGLAFSLRYFSLGEINYTDDQGTAQGTFSPYEFAFTGAYALKLSEQWSTGVGLRFIWSDLTQGQPVNGVNTNPGSSVAADVGVYYQGRQFNIDRGQKGQFSAGMNISNVGAKISYSESGQEDFLPANLRLGGAFNWQFDKYNAVTFLLDFNKLLVPTPPVRNESTGEVEFGKDDDVPVLTGIIQSFADAPGGWKEELQEINTNIGIEYWYDQTFALRGGFQYEHPNKGNRRYFTLGLGIKYNVFGLDFAYLIPADQSVRSPLENTLRFTLFFDLNSLASAGNE